MVFCGQCGKKAEDNENFCTVCGAKLKEITVQVTEQVGEIIKEELKENINSEDSAETQEQQLFRQTTRELGNKLEEMVERIFRDQGYETATRQKLQGISGSYNEIDVLATRKNIRIAIECKNYSEDRKVGIKEIRDFISKLDDLEINRGIFVTSSYFSEDAMNLAENNPSGKNVELWDREDLMQKVMTVTLGRNSKTNLMSKMVRIENTLPLQGTIDDYTILHLKNKEKVAIKKKELTFRPIYVVSFYLHEEFRAPDKQMYSHHNEGEYYVDGLSGRILYRIDKSGKKEYSLSKEEMQMISDMQELEPRMIEVEDKPDYHIIIIKPGIDKKNAEFQVRTQVANDNRSVIQYKVKRSRDEYEEHEYPHMPQHSSIQCKTRVVTVPRLEIEFESQEHSYVKIVMMASEVVIRDDISVCKHIFGKKTTFAVCEVCGIAKCEKDIILGNGDDCYCKKHVPDEIKDSKKDESYTSKLKQKFWKR